MVTDPASDLQQVIGDTIYMALESTRVGYITDTITAAAIATGNIMAAVFAARPAIAPPPPAEPPQWQPPTRPRHGFR